MKEKEFKELLKQIEDNTYSSNTIEINGTGWEEDTKRPEALTDKEVILLVEAVRKNSNITCISLPSNNIGDEGAFALATLPLERLGLSNNHITVKGATVLARTNIRALNLAENAIIWNCYKEDADYYNQPFASPEELQGMIDSFISNKTIVTLDLHSCYFSDEHDELIARLIHRNTTIKILSLDTNYFSDEALKYIGENESLEVLSLRCNNITRTTINYLRKNQSLKTIDFGPNNNLTKEDIIPFKYNNSMEEVILNSNLINITNLREEYNINLSGEDSVVEYQ